ncbi:MAG: hypothetical protein KTR18_12410 [Acidiferrobacterales bacterium]|nr:hypothetical protein [Acidiferrobacterales bacterium]
MESLRKLLLVGAISLGLSACGSDGTSSSGGGTDKDASSCVTRTLKTVYTNDCEFDVNVILLEDGATFFRVNANRATTRSVSGNPFGACRAPSEPILNADSSQFTCS